MRLPSASARTPEISPGARRQILAFTAAVGFYWASLYVFVPLLAPEADRLGATVGGVGAVLAAYGLAELLFRVPLGIWTDRLRRRLPLMVGALLLSAAAAVGMGLSSTPLALGALRGLSGVAASAWVPITLLAMDLFPDDRIAWALGLVNFSSGVGEMAALLLGGLLAQFAGYPAAFIAGGVLALLGAAVVLAFVREAPRQLSAPSPSWGRLRAIVRHPRVLAASAMGVILQYVVTATLFGFIPLIAVQRMHAGGAALGVLSLVLVGPSTALPLVGARLAERKGPSAATALGLGIAGVGTALVPLAGSIVALGAAGAVISAGIGLATPVLMGVAVQSVPKGERGSAMGLYQALYAVGTFAGPSLAGLIGQHFGPTAMFASIAAVSLAGAAIAASVLR